MRTVPLDKVADVDYGYAFESKRFGDEGDLPLVRIRDVVRGRSNTYYTGEFDARYIVNNGDLLVGMDGEFNRERWAGGKALLNQRVCRIKVADPSLDESYLYWFLPEALKEIERQTPFVTVKHLSAKEIKAIALPLPPIEEQWRIASILDAADALRTKRRQALTKLDTLTQAIFVNMFGVSSESTASPARLSDHAIVITKGTTPTSVGFDFADSGIPFVRVQDLQGGTVRAETIELCISKATNKALSRSILKPYDVVISIAGTIGRVAIIPASAPEMNCNQAVALVRTSSTLSPEYLAAWLNTQDAQQQIGGSRVTGTISNLSLTSIRNLMLPIPDRLSQQRFADRMLEVKRLIESVETSASALNTSFESLQHRAFRGEL
jgi:type I restriction enzyme S subunit